MNRNDSERGAVLAIGVVGISVVLLIAAIVVDLGSTRAQRASARVVTDAAATAGAIQLIDGAGPEVCAAALSYVEAHIGATSGVACGAFPNGCDASTASVRAFATAGDLTVMIVHPVDNGDPLLRPSVVGGSTQPATAADGDRCSRVGVSLVEPTKTFFGGAIGDGVTETSVHSVAMLGDSDSNQFLINLLILEREECDVLSVGGGGSSGGISVGASVDPATGEVYPGRIAVDSDGSAGCGGGGTISTNGAGAQIRADGLPGCDGELSPAGSGAGCGQIDTFAPGAPGCNPPACSGSGVVSPLPSRSRRRLSRAPIDHLYDCKAVYPVALGIDGCTDGSRGPYITQLQSLATSRPSSFRVYTDEGFDCRIGGGPSTAVTVPVGNWIVDCNELRVQRSLTFNGGNIIFEGDVSVGSQGELRINANNTASASWSTVYSPDLTEHSADAAWVYFDGGTLSKGGGGSLELNATMVYFDENSTIDMGGGAGRLDWTAPFDGPFQNLALWSDSPAEHSFAGQAALQLEGVVFLPKATMTYTGNGGHGALEAQFIARKVQTQGNGALRLVPKFERSVTHSEPSETALIR